MVCVLVEGRRLEEDTAGATRRRREIGGSSINVSVPGRRFRADPSNAGRGYWAPGAEDSWSRKTRPCGDWI